jgi:hypothetical protein
VFHNIIHITKNPVTIHMQNTSLVNDDLGRHTLFEFLHSPHKGGKLIFGRRENNSPLYELKYSIYPITFKYYFDLIGVRCLKQIRGFGSDKLYSTLEINASELSKERGIINSYQLGTFNSFDVSPIYSKSNRKIKSKIPKMKKKKKRKNYK